MPNIEVVEKKSINMAALKEELAEVKKRDTELSFRGNKTEEYLNEFAILKPKQAEELYKKIESINIPRLKDSHINKIIDLMPASVAELKVIMQGYALPVTNENLKKIVDCVAEFLPKKKEEKEETSKQKLAAPEIQKSKIPESKTESFGKQGFSDKKE